MDQGIGQMSAPYGSAYGSAYGEARESTAWRGGRGVLQGAFQLMAALDQAGQAGVTRLAALSGLPKSTAYRLLEQLAELGAVERQGGAYRMGPRMFRLGQGWQPHPGLRQAAREPVLRVVAATGATVGITVLREGRTLVLEWATGQDASLTPLLDAVSWPWFTAAGKAQAAWRPDLARQLGPLPDSWPDEAAAIRERGVAFDRGEVVEGVCCVAVPLLGRGGTAVGALCLLTTSAERLEPLADIARRAGGTITARLRHRRMPDARALFARRGSTAPD